MPILLLLLLGGAAIATGGGGGSRKRTVAEMRASYEKAALTAQVDPTLNEQQANSIRLVIYQAVQGVFDPNLGYKAPSTADLFNYGTELDQQGYPQAAFACRAMAASLEQYRAELAQGKYQR